MALYSNRYAGIRVVAQTWPDLPPYSAKTKMVDCSALYVGTNVHTPGKPRFAAFIRDENSYPDGFPVYTMYGILDDCGSQPKIYETKVTTLNCSTRRRELRIDGEITPWDAAMYAKIAMGMIEYMEPFVHFGECMIAKSDVLQRCKSCGWAFKCGC
jgi:hypothetical protein